MSYFDWHNTAAGVQSSTVRQASCERDRISRRRRYYRPDVVRRSWSSSTNDEEVTRPIRESVVKSTLNLKLIYRSWYSYRGRRYLCRTTCIKNGISDSYDWYHGSLQRREILFKKNVSYLSQFVFVKNIVCFLPRDALLSAVYAVVVCLCVCVCVSVCLCVCVRHTPVLYQNG